MRTSLIVAMARNRVIGRDNRLPWRLPADLRRFKQLTMGHMLLVGRKTFESIGRPLPGRTTIVLTRDPDWSADGVLVAHGIDAALAQADMLDGDVVVAGGGEVYAAALPFADSQVITEVRLRPAGDAFYPELDRSEWEETRRDHHDGYDRVWWERRNPAA
jgi:dihydrofolate reductase